MFFRRHREKKKAEEQSKEDEARYQRNLQLARDAERRLEMQEQLDQRSRERELFGEPTERARKYGDIAKRLLRLVVKLNNRADSDPDARNDRIVAEITRTGILLDEEGGLSLMQAVCTRVTELGHAAAEKVQRETTAYTYEGYRSPANVASAGRTLEEEWKGIGQWR